MSPDTGELIARLRSVALRTGRFDSCEGHEPPSPPGKGIRGAIWIEDVDTITSGLSVISLRLLFIMRISRDLAEGTSEGLDRIDPEVTTATLAVMGALAEDRTLGGAIREVDWRGQTSEQVRAEARYFEHRDGQAARKYRAMLLRVPCLIDDVWTIGGSG